MGRMRFYLEKTMQSADRIDVTVTADGRYSIHVFFEGRGLTVMLGFNGNYDTLTIRTGEKVVSMKVLAGNYHIEVLEHDKVTEIPIRDIYIIAELYVELMNYVRKYLIDILY